MYLLEKIVKAYELLKEVEREIEEDENGRMV
jgi:hypothetical protein